MRDLNESSRLFEASSRLQSAATALAKLRNGQTLSDDDRENLVWAGNFLSEVDSATNPSGTGGASGDLSVQATDVRPSFYTTLLNIEPAFKGAGINADSDLRTFLSATYQFLESQGSAQGATPKSQLRLAEVMLEELAMALLIRLTGNGVPAEPQISPLLLA